jgi:hypothetical protein
MSACNKTKENHVNQAQPMRYLLAVAGVLLLLPSAKGQSLANTGDSPRTAASTTAVIPPAQTDFSYVRPTQKTKISNYLFDTIGPYPIVGAAIAAAINQADRTPPEWGQGAAGYGKRFGSDFGIAAVSTTTRYALAQAFREDTLYYRCECKGTFPRLGHALVSTLTARRGDDGHRVFSFSSLAAPYAGTMTAVYAWYPRRYDAMDGLRMGNYNLLGVMGGNIAMEFLYRGPHSLLARMHLNNPNAAPAAGTTP